MRHHRITDVSGILFVGLFMAVFVYVLELALLAPLIYRPTRTGRRLLLIIGLSIPAFAAAAFGISAAASTDLDQLSFAWRTYLLLLFLPAVLVVVALVKWWNTDAA